LFAALAAGNFPTFHGAGRQSATQIEMAEEVWSTIAALKDERYAAMLSADAGTLDRLLDDRLRYVHCSGYVDNRRAVMSNFGRVWHAAKFFARERASRSLNG